MQEPDMYRILSKPQTLTQLHFIESFPNHNVKMGLKTDAKLAAENLQRAQQLLMVSVVVGVFSHLTCSREFFYFSLAGWLVLREESPSCVSMETVLLTSTALSVTLTDVISFLPNALETMRRFVLFN